MAKMILLFERNLQKLIPSDIDYIFAYNEFVISDYCGQAKIINYNKWESSESEEPRKAIDKFFSNFNDEVQIIKNTFYSNWLAPIYSLISQLNIIIKENYINELILVKGSEFVFSTFELAECEGNPVVYQSSWLFNPVIEQYYSGTDIHITWKKCSKFSSMYKILNWCREHIIRIREIIAEFYRYKKTKNRTNQVCIKNGVNAVCFVNLQGQYNFIKAYLNNCLDIIPVIITPKAFDNECIVIKGILSPIKVINNLRISYHAVNKEFDEYLILDNRRISINKKTIRAALITELFIYYNAIDKIVNTYAKIPYLNFTYMITCMSQGRSMVKYTEASKRIGLKHINYQYVSLGKRCFPIMRLADEYYIYEEGSYTFYKNQSPIFHFYLPQLKKTHISKEKMIVIYTQPDQYAELYLRFIECVLHHTSNLNSKYKIIIKLHYRQNRKDDFEKFKSFNNVNVVSDEYSIVELMDLSTFCISMTSSVLSEATFYKVPAFIFVEDEGLLQYVIKSGIGYPEINYIVRSIDELIEKIQSFDNIDYQNRYDTFLARVKEKNEEEVKSNDET